MTTYRDESYLAVPPYLELYNSHLDFVCTPKCLFKTRFHLALTYPSSLNKELVSTFFHHRTYLNLIYKILHFFSFVNRYLLSSTCDPTLTCHAKNVCFSKRVPFFLRNTYQWFSQVSLLFLVLH